MLTLTQLYNLGLTENKDIFSGLNLPSGSPMSRDIMINTIMEHCGLNIPLYADVNVMQSAINVWSSKHQYTFKHIAKIYEASYSPIENTDRYEDITITHDRDLTNNKIDNSNTNDNINSDKTENATSSNTVTTGSTTGTTGNDTITHSGTDTTTEEVTTSAYNANTYQPDTKTTTGLLHGEQIQDYNSSNTTVSGSTSSNGTDIKEFKDSTKGEHNTNRTANEKVNENETTRTINHTHGNIGVMDNSTMQQKDYELIGNFNPYNFIAGIFENELTLFVY